MTGPAPRTPGRGRRPAARTVSPARRVALDVLIAVREQDAYANLLLPARIRQAGLSRADAALATELCYGTLRMLGNYDRVIALAARRPVAEIDPPILDVLRLGAHQLLALRTPAHAAVNESVEQARRVGSRSATGFANGVLRQIARRDAEDWMREVVEHADGPDDRLAARSSHPTWIIRAFRRALEADGRAGELEELLAADNAAPAVNLVTLPGLDVDGPGGDAAGWADEATAGLGPNRYSPVGHVLDRGDPDLVSSGSRGRIRVQDEGSQLVALALSRARPIAAGERWLDLCAGPGGKAALLAAEARAGGASLVANEAVPARADLVRRALAAIPAGTAEVRVGDGRLIGDEHPHGFDRILVDAPCTGLGALRRRPEARWRKRPGDVPALTTLQRELADAAVAALAPGGLLAYATCSPHPAETRMLVADLLAAHGERLRPLPTARILTGICRTDPGLGDTTVVQLWPHRHGTDAMFLALFEARGPATVSR